MDKPEMAEVAVYALLKDAAGRTTSNASSRSGSYNKSVEALVLLILHSIDHSFVAEDISLFTSS